MADRENKKWKLRIISIFEKNSRKWQSFATLQKQLGLSYADNANLLRCLSCYLLHNRGENHTNYKSEKTSPQSVIIRNSEEYRNWRNAIFAKYDYRCGICAIRTKNLNAHHLDSFHAFPEKRFEVSNGFCLCSKHHKMFHKQYGIRNNTQSQFFEYQSLMEKELQNGLTHTSN